MTENRCKNCGRMLLAAGTICEICAGDTRQRLAAIPKLYVQSEAYLEPGRGGVGSSGSERTIGVNLAALGFRQAFEILAILEDWERTVRVKSLGQIGYDGLEREGEIELDDDGLIVTTLRAPFSNERPIVRKGSVEERVKGVCEFLLAHIRWLAQYEAAGDFVADVAKIHAQGLAATRQIEEKPTRIKCPADIEMWIDGDMKTVTCNHPLYLKDDIFTDIKCKGCGADWTTAGLLRVAIKSGAQVLLDPVAIGGYLGMSVANVHIFAKRDEIEKVGKKYPLVEFVRARHAG